MARETGDKLLAKSESNNNEKAKQVSRRRFLKASGLVVIAGGFGHLLVACGEPTPVVGEMKPTPSAVIVPGMYGTPAQASATPNAAFTATSGPTATFGPGATPSATSGAIPASTQSGTPAAVTTSPGTTATAFLKFWEQGRYPEMYSLLTGTAKTYISQEKFLQRYQDISTEASISSLQSELAPGFSPPNPLPARMDVPFKVTFKTQKVGDFSQDNNLTLQLEDGQWLVDWSPTNIFKELDNTLYQVKMVQGKAPTRGEIVDRQGQPLAQSVPREGGKGWVRRYPQQQVAAQVIGYVTPATADDLKNLGVKGYTAEDMVGRSGVEDWAEEVLNESAGGQLAVVQPDGQVVATIARQPGTQSPKLVLNLDLGIQKAAEAALGGRTGSIVVMNPNDGAVLALANFPVYNPNDFITGFSDAQYKALNDDPRHPFLNRAVNGKLPVGSTFKAVTTAAALEKLGLDMQAKFFCSGRWTGLGEQNAKDCYLKSGHGNITLFEGLAQSCDVVYYELGKRLNELDPNVLPQMARGFGFGSPTGITGQYDTAGQVPDPKWKQEQLNQSWVPGDGVNLAIGQGYFLASPLQLATAYAAIANGGKLILPRLADHTDGQPGKTYPPLVKAKLPVNENNLAQIRQALLAVTQGKLGTARQSFAGSKVPVAGKTGTAESGVEQPHAWFVCYAPADQPKYVVVVCLENGGFGNEQAAPIARKVIDALPF